MQDAVIRNVLDALVGVNEMVRYSSPCVIVGMVSVLGICVPPVPTVVRVAVAVWANLRTPVIAVESGIAACTIAVVAICVVLVAPAAVGAAGVPVNVGEESGANPVVEIGKPLAF